jgi:hypothetical protein
MILSLAINENCQACFCWLTARRTWVRMHPVDLQTTALAIISRNQQCTHLQRHVHFRESKILSLPVAPSHHQHRRSAQIPIAFAAPLSRGAAFPLPPDAISCLGAFRPPVSGARG